MLICHCQMCQKASGSAFAPVMFVKSGEIEVAGATQGYKSSVQGERHFCPACGSSLFFKRFSMPQVCGVMVGSLDDAQDFKPALQVCMSSSVTWLETMSSAQGFPEKPAHMTPTLIYDPMTGQASERS